MIKGKIISSHWNPDRKRAIVVKQTKYGHFVGVAEAVEEDREIATEWDGYKFAEYQCNLQHLKERSKQMYQRYLGIQSAYNNLCQANDSSDPILCKLERQMYLAKRDAEIAREEYYHVKDYYSYYADQVVSDRKVLQEWKKMREEKNEEPAS